MVVRTKFSYFIFVDSSFYLPVKLRSHMHGYIHRSFECMPNKIMEPLFRACSIVQQVHIMRIDCAGGGVR